jgi:very-short-patch-repair endonuclease
MQHTPAEKELGRILARLGNGALRGKFIREWAFKKWILDFYLYEIRVGIEVDGQYHTTATQRERDKEKNFDCESAGITLLRITNAEVFGDRDALVAKLRVAYREGLRRSRQRPK